MDVHDNKCEAYCDEPPGYWHTHRCGSQAKYERDGHRVCGTHARVFDRHGSLTWEGR